MERKQNSGIDQETENPSLAITRREEPSQASEESRQCSGNAKDNYCETVLHRAVKSGNLEIVKYLVEKGFDVNAKDNNGVTVLHWAVKSGNLELVKSLVEKGADVNAKYNYCETVLHRAVKSGNLEIVKCLVEKGADVNAKSKYNETVLHRAVKSGKLELVKYLVEKGADVNAKSKYNETVLHWAVKSGKLEIVKYLVEKGADVNAKDYDGVTVLHWAAESINLEIVKYLVEKGADVNAKYNYCETVLHRAVKSGKLELVKYLVEKGAIVNGEDDDCKTVLHWAAESGNLEIVKYLVEKGADVNAKYNYCETVLHRAVKSGKLELVKYLVEKGADVNAKGNDGVTVLHWAAVSGNLELVKCLVEKGADVNAKDNYCETVLHWAVKSGKLELVKYLVEKGADENAKDNYGVTVLHWAAVSGNLELVKCLVEKCFDANAKCNYSLTLLLRQIWITTRPNTQEKLENEFQQFAHALKHFSEEDQQKFLTDFWFNKTQESQIMKKIEENVTLNRKEKLAVNLLFRALKNMGCFHGEKTREINEILKDYLDKYLEFAHKNVVAMRLTEVILYSFCSSKCRNLVVPENYFLKYFNKRFSSEIQLGAVVANSLLQKEFCEKSNEDVILFILDIWKRLNKNEALRKSAGSILGFSRIEIEDCLYKEVSKLAGFIKKCEGPTFPESLYTILCQLFEGINHLSSFEIIQLPLVIINIFNEKDKSKIFMKGNTDKLNEQDRLVLNCFYVSINILSKCYEASSNILSDELFLLRTFEEFFDFISSNFVSQRICEALLYCICNVVDKRQIRDKGSWVTIFEQCFCNAKVSTEIKLTSSYILSYLIDEEEIKPSVMDYLKSVLEISVMKKYKNYCGFREEEIRRCIEELDKVKGSDGDGNSLLHIAVKNLQPGLCRTLIQSGSNIEAVNDQGNSPLFELFNNVDNGHMNENVEKAIEILNILIESGIDVNKITNSGTNIFQLASQWNSERLMLSLLSKRPEVTCLTETDFKLAFTKQWFEYAATLIKLMTEDFLQSLITNEIFQLAMIHSDPKFLMFLFVKSNPGVQQSVIEDLMNHFALIDNYNNFVNLLNDKLESVKYFVEKGVDVNAKDNKGRTVLHRAAESGNLERVKYLEEKGATRKFHKNLNKSDVVLHGASELKFHWNE